MGKDFELTFEATVPVDPETVWAAIATGPGVSSWYLGRTDIDGTTVRTAFGEAALPPATITAAEQPTRFAYRTGPAPDGRFQAAEFLVEGRDSSATTLRIVNHGFLPGDDWEAEFEAMRTGTEMFLVTLATYLTHFAGRAGTPVTAFGPMISDWDAAWATLYDALGLSASPKPGDLTTEGAEVFHTNGQTLGLRTEDGLYRYLRGFHGPMVASHVVFPPVVPDPAAEEAFLTALYSR